MLGEKYSKEKYEEAVKDRESAEERYTNIGGGYYEKGSYVRFPQSFYDDLVGEINKAEERIQKLKGKAEKEAIKLNEQHVKKLERIRKALEDLKEFEREELGMHQSAEQKAAEQ